MTKKLLVTGLALVLMVGLAQASTLTLTSAVTAVTDLEGTPVAMPDFANTFPGVPLLYQVDFSFQISNLAAGQQGFGNMVFDLTLAPGLTDAAGWVADASQFKLKSVPLTMTNLWSDNGDIGANTADLKNIAVGINGFGASTWDPRATLGQAAPVYVGSVYLVWDGATAATLDTNLWQFSTIGADKQLTMDAAGVKVDNAIQFGPVPEPATMSLLALGGLAALIRRRK